jgi:hypothetical protein
MSIAKIIVLVPNNESGFIDIKLIKNILSMSIKNKMETI